MFADACMLGISLNIPSLCKTEVSSSFFLRATLETSISWSRDEKSTSWDEEDWMENMTLFKRQLKKKVKFFKNLKKRSTLVNKGFQKNKLGLNSLSAEFPVEETAQICMIPIISNAILQQSLSWVSNSMSMECPWHSTTQETAYAAFRVGLAWGKVHTSSLNLYLITAKGDYKAWLHP